MTEQLIVSETAKLAKEKGFDIPYINVESSYPTQSLLQKWLREKHNIHITIYKGLNLINNRIYYTFIETKDREFNTYEEALEIALQDNLRFIDND